METTDFCSYELSKRLKDCGFNEPCGHYYNGHGNLNRYADTDRINRNTNGHHTPSCSAPTLAQAQKWLREKKKIDVLVYNCACGYLWEVSKANNGTGLILFDEKGDDENSGCWTSYEGSLSAGISASLELIKKGELDMADLFAKCETCKHWGTNDCPESSLCFSLELKPFYVPTIGYLRHEPTGYQLAVYKPISRFKRLMLKWCFGVKFEKIKTKSHENSWCENEL